MYDKETLLEQVCIERDELQMQLVESNLTHSFEEFDWSLEVASNLSELNDAVSSLEAATAVDNEFIRLATKGILNGSGIAVEDVYPSMESDDGQKRTAWDIVKAIFKFMTKIFVKIAEFLQNLYAIIFNSTMALNNQNDKLNDKIREKASSKIINKSTTLGREVSLLTVDGTRPRFGQELIANMRTLISITKTCLQYHSRNLVNVGELLGREMSRAEFKDDNILKPFIDALNSVELDKLRKLAGANKKVEKDTRWSENGSLYRTDTLLGEKALFFFEVPTAADDTDVRKISNAFRQSMLFTDVAQTKTNVRGEGVMETMTISHLKEIYALNKELIKLMGDYKKDQKEMDKKAEAIHRYTDALKDKSQKDMMDGTSTGTQVQHFNQVMAIQRHYAEWMKDPYANLLKHLLSVIRATIAVSHKCLANYE